jgi:hypothetical protein
MDKIIKDPSSAVIGRITSVDFFRGVTMFLLIGESTRLYDHISSIKSSSVMHWNPVQPP